MESLSPEKDKSAEIQPAETAVLLAGAYDSGYRRGIETAMHIMALSLMTALVVYEIFKEVLWKAD